MDKPRAFKTAAAFRAWLEKHHRQESALLVQIFKVHAASRGLTYALALDEALCFGWIDGHRKSIDEDSFSIRFSPRKPKSKWSNVNIRHAKRLEAEGRMHESGLKEFHGRETKNVKSYSFERAAVELAPAYEKKLRANQKAWKFFQEQAPWYQRTTKFWIMDAKKEETQQRRLDALIDCCARGTTVAPLTRPEKKR